MSRGKKLLLLSLVTLIALIAVGQLGHHADPGGTKTGECQDYLAATGRPRSRCLSGHQHLANETGHLRISINFTWLLLTGFLVLFMQVGFAFLVTGLTRRRTPGT